MAIKNLVITPVMIGRISIGERVEKDGKQLPKKSDEFHVTSNLQQNGQWVVPKGIEEAQKVEGGKLRTIPVRVLFDTPDNNFRSGYACFNNDGRQVCAGNGEKASRLSNKGRQDVECPGHEYCEFGKANRCKPYARLLVGLESMFEKDPLSAFAFRTTGYNSVNALTSRFAQYHALLDGKIAGLPCNLVLRPKSTAKSRRQPIYYVDLEPRTSLIEASKVAKAWRKSIEEDAGLNLKALDDAVAAGFAAMPFIDSDETIQDEEVAGEFYPEPSDQVDHQPSDNRQQQEHRHLREAPPPVLVPQSQHRSEGGVDDLLGDEPSGNQDQPSAALQSVLKKMATISDPNSIPAARVWIKEHRELNEFERKHAMNQLEKHSASLGLANAA